MTTIEQEYSELVKTIQYHNNLYYNQDEPEISDFEYDKLTQRLRKIENEHPEFISTSSPSQKVGGTAKRSVGVSIEHKVPMLSLLDVFDKTSVKEFVKKVKSDFPDASFVVEKKIDGLSMSAVYKKGKLVLASTRGNGLIGEDITENAKNILSLPKEIETDIALLEVRGEVYMSEKSFTDVNLEQEDKGEKLFKNARNCAAGTLRSLDPALVKKRKLDIFIFNIQDINGKSFSLHSDSLSWLKSQGFSVSPGFTICNTENEVVAAIDKIGKERNSLSYGIDGAVVKVNQLSIRDTMGNTSKVPKWAVAYKYPPEQKETVITDIRIQVGRTGRLTPLAVFTPVDIAGTTIEKATLHNQEQIKRLNINIGDTVLLQKAGDVIPEIAKVIKKADNKSSFFELPSVCPVCGAKVEKKNGVDMYCSSQVCPAKLQRSIEFFASKECMDISGMGPSIITALIEHKYIRSFTDIYKLSEKRKDLINANIIGKAKTVDNLLNAIEKSKKKNMDRLIKALGVKNVGLHAGQIISSKYKNMYALSTATYDDLVALDGIGDVCANSIINFYTKEETLTLIKELESLGVNINYIEDNKKSETLNGLTFVITGTLPNIKRTECANLVTKNGGKVSGSISKNTSFLIAGENAGSKLDKANSLNVKVITEADFLEMIK